MDLHGAKKMGQKGIPRTQQIRFDQFLDSLYDNKQFSCETHSLQAKVNFRIKRDKKILRNEKCLEYALKRRYSTAIFSSLDWRTMPLAAPR